MVLVDVDLKGTTLVVVDKDVVVETAVKVLVTATVTVVLVVMAAASIVAAMPKARPKAFANSIFFLNDMSDDVNSRINMGMSVLRS